MAQFKLEQEIANEQEQKLADAIRTIVSTGLLLEDCRQYVSGVRLINDAYKTNMVIGCGGSHIYIHRSHQFIDGKHTHDNNVRWGIITD